MEPAGSMLHTEGSPITFFLSQINQISRINNYFFNINFQLTVGSIFKGKNTPPGIEPMTVAQKAVILPLLRKLCI